MTKKIAVLALSVVLCVFLALSVVSISAATFVVEGDWKLEKPSASVNTDYYIAAYLGSDKEVVIPSALGDNIISKINSSAFSNTSVESCVIPDTVTAIDGYAFLNAASLKSVTIPKSVTNVGSGVFANCTSLTTVNFPVNSGFESITGSFFSGCTSLQELYVPDGVKNIYNYAFLNCTALSKVVVPPTVTTIYDQAFDGCSQLTLYVYNDSYALEYAQTNEIPYVILGDYVTPTEPPVTEPTTPPTTEPTTPKETYIMGDVDLDGSITVKDASKIQKYLASLEDLSDLQLFLANNDGVGSATISDATQIQKYVAGFKGIINIGEEVQY